jgi:dTDP-4-dehydrorhamnose reductase
MSRILLIGRDGQLGAELYPHLTPLGEVTRMGRDQVDLTVPDQLRQAIRQVTPQVIVNAAAYTAVDRAESEPDLAKAINATAPTVMAEEAQKLNATLIHVSTDYVFDGTQNRPYLETDAPHPMGVYGQSKLLGEQGIQAVDNRHIILRTAWVYGVGGKSNFVKTMLRLGATREDLRVVVDQVGSPTWTGDLARAIAHLTALTLEGASAFTKPAGLYHYANSGAISWYDFAVAIFEEAAALGFPLTVQRVVPISTAEYPTTTARPAYSVLSTKKIQDTLGEIPPHWRQSLRSMLKAWWVKTQGDRPSQAQIAS